ncbi:MAG: aminotransferase class I/II-fold pyridoxal phosphate-dependent enzyme [Pseudomonadota bacterium]
MNNHSEGTNNTSGMSVLQFEANMGQAKNDLWIMLQETVDQLAALNARKEVDAELELTAKKAFDEIREIQKYWVYPSSDQIERIAEYIEARDYKRLSEHLTITARLASHFGDRASQIDENDISDTDLADLLSSNKHYFTVLIVNDLSQEEQAELSKAIREIQSDSDDFVYDFLHVNTLEDAFVAAHVNHDIQAVMLWQHFETGDLESDGLAQLIQDQKITAASPATQLAALLNDSRPQLNLYLVTKRSPMNIGEETHELFDRVFYEMDNSPEFHLTILAGMRDRYETPFFNALKNYAAAPVGNFHALPIARGNSILNSKWIQDMGEFYGLNIFLAETSSTSGGLDSLNAPTGTLKEAQDRAAKTWGSMHTYFVTGGTSQSNKAVVQALVTPGDIALIDRNAHKSHHYGLVLGGCNALYLDSYPLEEYAMFGAIPLRAIKEELIKLKKLGRLDRVKVILLTSCTFDGLTYNQQMFMEELLAIKPDLCFLWDEAWYAYGTFSPLSRQRTAMYSARKLEAKYASDEYRAEYEKYKKEMDQLDPEDPATWLDRKLMPDPDQVRIRVYSTHSTHKSMSALRQGSMLHVYDQDYRRKTEETLNEAILTHSTTSPNYQILASLDLARRQADLEGYAMIANIYQISIFFREQVNQDPVLSKYFRILEPSDFIPPEYRKSGFSSYSDANSDHASENMLSAWAQDEFVLDPTRITLYLANTGFNGNEFKVDVLMEKYGIQINKTSINSVLFIITIGVNWSSMANLLDVLRSIAADIERANMNASKAESTLFENKVKALSTGLPPLANFSHFHRNFKPHAESAEGDMRTPFFLNYNEDNRRYVKLDQALELVKDGVELVSTSFVVPYPPGFPILVPGQVVTEDIIDFMLKLDVKEIHGFRREVGLSVFTDEALESAKGELAC